MYKVHGFFDNQMVIKYRMAHIPAMGDTVRIAGERYGKVTEIIFCTDERDPLGDTRVNIRIESLKEDDEGPPDYKPKVIGQFPMQPIELDNKGVARFKQNRIIRKLLDVASENGFGLNQIAAEDFTAQEFMQLAQAIGYSVDGYADLHYASAESIDAADEIVAAILSERTAMTPIKDS